MSLKQFVHLPQLGIVVGENGDLGLLALHLALRSLEVVTLANLAHQILKRVVHLGEVGLGHDVKRRHGGLSPQQEFSERHDVSGATCSKDAAPQDVNAFTAS